jgi:adenylate cyclase, class 2
MTLEIEMKFSVGDFCALEATLRQWQARPGPLREEADQYFNAPDRDFATCDEALRVRRRGASNCVTYKGPKQGGPTKTRTEIEVILEEGAEAAARFCRLLEHLGYRAVALVRKNRTSYELKRDGWDVQICCDEVEGLGRFVEVEIVTSAERKDEAQAAVQRIAGELGLSVAEKRSYLEMMLARRGAV